MYPNYRAQLKINTKNIKVLNELLRIKIPKVVEICKMVSRSAHFELV